MKSIDELEMTGPGDDELFAGLHRSVAGATLSTSVADVEALGRRARRRHRAALAGVGTTAAALVAAVAVLAPPGSGGASRDVGFTIEHRADGTIDLTLEQSLNPQALQQAMDDAGIATDIQTIKVPLSMVVERGVYCAQQLVPWARGSDAIEEKILPNGKRDFNHMVIDKSKIPASGVITLIRFEDDEGNFFINFGLTIGKPAPCVPVQNPIDIER